MAQTVFRPNQINIKDGPVSLKLSKEFVIPEEETVEEVPEYTGPTADQLRQEAEEFKKQWELEKSQLIAKAQSDADDIIKNAEAAAFNEVKKQSDQASVIKNSAETEAQSILSKARLEADQIIKTAHDEEQRIFDKAQKDGYDKGHEEGYQLGNQEAERLVDRAHYDVARDDGEDDDIGNRNFLVRAKPMLGRLPVAANLEKHLTGIVVVLVVLPHHPDKLVVPEAFPGEDALAFRMAQKLVGIVYEERRVLGFRPEYVGKAFYGENDDARLVAAVLLPRKEKGHRGNPEHGGRVHGDCLAAARARKDGGVEGDELIDDRRIKLVGYEKLVVQDSLVARAHGIRAFRRKNVDARDVGVALEEERLRLPRNCSSPRSADNAEQIEELEDVRAYRLEFVLHRSRRARVQRQVVVLRRYLDVLPHQVA